MPILTCYVDDRVMMILEREAKARDSTPEQLAENAIAEAAIRSVPPPVRDNFRRRADG